MFLFKRNIDDSKTKQTKLFYNIIATNKKFDQFNPRVQVCICAEKKKSGTVNILSVSALNYEELPCTLDLPHTPGYSLEEKVKRATLYK
jgi:hypothetical protein